MTPGAWPGIQGRRALGVAVLAGLLILAAFALRNVVVAIGLAGFLAYLLNPWVDRLEARGVPRSASTVLLLALAAGLLIGLALGLLPVLQAQIGELLDRLPLLLERVRLEWLPWIEAKLAIELPRTSEAALLELFDRARAVEATGPFTALAASAFRSSASLVLSMFQLGLVPVLGFYALRDGEALRRTLLSLVPVDFRHEALGAARQVNAVVSAYLRGQLTVCLILGGLYSVGFALSGVPSGVLVGILTGLLALIPIVGPAVGLGLALLLTLVEHGADAHALYVLASFGVIQGLEGTIITPRVVGERLGLHPLAVILGLVAGGELLGFIGVILAVPALAVFRVLVWPRLSPADSSPPSAQEASVARQERDQIDTEGRN